MHSYIIKYIFITCACCFLIMMFNNMYTQRDVSVNNVFNKIYTNMCHFRGTNAKLFWVYRRFEPHCCFISCIVGGEAVVMPRAWVWCDHSQKHNQEERGIYFFWHVNYDAGITRPGDTFPVHIRAIKNICIKFNTTQTALVDGDNRNVRSLFYQYSFLTCFVRIDP